MTTTMPSFPSPIRNIETMKKLTPKQEAFCLAYVETGNASEAYRRSYSFKNMKPETINRKGFGMIEMDKIRTRIEQLQQVNRTKHDITIERLSREAFELLEYAKSEGQVAPGVAALTLLAKMGGLLTGKREEVGDGGDRTIVLQIAGETIKLEELGW